MASTPAETREAARRIVDQLDSAEVTGPQFHAYMATMVTTDDITSIARALLASHGEREAVLEEALAIAEQEADRWRVRTNGGAYSTAQKIAHAIRSLKTGEG